MGVGRGTFVEISCAPPRLYSMLAPHVLVAGKGNGGFWKDNEKQHLCTERDGSRFKN